MPKRAGQASVCLWEESFSLRLNSFVNAAWCFSCSMLLRMPVWLTPRVRLGVTAALIVLIACGLLVTPYLFHDDVADAPTSLTSINSSVDLHTVPPPPSRKPPIVLPHVVLSDIDSTPRPPSGPLSQRRGVAGGDASGSTTSSTQADSPESTQSAESDQTSQADQNSQGDSAGPSYTLASDGSPGGGSSGGSPGGGGAPFGANGILVPPSAGSGDTRGGTPKQQQPIPLGYNSGVVPPPPPPVVIPPVVPPVVVQPVTLPTVGSGPGDNPGDPPPDPPVVQVPEPASLAMAGIGALGFIIRARRARKRRG